MTISVSGEDSGNINLFVGDEGDLGSQDPFVYELASFNPASDEEITIDLTAPPFPPGQFFSVLVIEANVFVERYTIEVSCEEP